MKQRKKMNPRLRETIERLKEIADEHDGSIWQTVAETLGKPTRNIPAVNLSRLNRHCEEDESVVVPGKVLGSGTLDKALTVAAFDFSDRARRVIEEDGQTVDLISFAEKHARGTDVRIMK